MRPVLLSLALVTTAACSVPPRENPHDPANLPDVSLSVSPLAGTPWTTFTYEAETKPSDAKLRLDVDGDGEFETVMPSSSFSGRLVDLVDLPADMFGPSGTQARTITVGVEAKKGDARAYAFTAIELSNAAPVIDFGPDMVAAAWEQPDVRLHYCGEILACPPPDPDTPSDALTYSWRKIVGPDSLLPAAVASSAVTFVAPPEPQTLVFELTVSDGFAERRQPVNVRVGRPGWIGTEGPPRLLRFHTDSQRVDLPQLFPIVAASVTPSGNAWMVTGDYGLDVWEVARVSPGGRVLGRWPIPNGETIGSVGAVFGSEEDGGGWTLVGPSPQSFALLRLAPITSGTAGTVTTVSLPFAPDLIAPDPLLPGGAFAIADSEAAHVSSSGTPGTPFAVSLADRICVANDGAVWTAFSGFAEGTTDPITFVRRFGPDDAESPALELQGTLAGLVPGSDGVLVALSDAFFLQAVAVVVDPASGATILPAPPINIAASAIAGSGDGHLWLHSFQQATLHRLRPTLGAYEIAVDALFEDVGLDPYSATQPYPFVAADPSTGGLFISGGVATGAALFVRAPAMLVPFEQATPTTEVLLLLTDPTRGAYWRSQNEYDAVLQVTVQHLRRVDAQGSVLADVALPQDEVFQGVWTVAPDGSVLQSRHVGGSVSHSRVRRFDAAGSEIAAPVDFPADNVLSLGVDAGGDLVCVATVSSPSGEAVVRRVGEADFLAGSLVGGLPGAAATRDGACWGWLPDGTVGFADAIGSQVVPFAPGAKTITADPYDETAWVYYQPAPLSPDAPAIYHLDTAGVVLGSFEIPEKLAPGAFGANPTFYVTRACDPAEATDLPECRELWFADDNTPATVYRMDGAGELLHAATVSAGAVRAIDVR